MSNQLLTLMFTQAWQIALLAVVVAIVTRTIARNRPHLAHAMWILVLIKCVTPPIWGHSLGVFSQLQTRWASDEQLTNPASTLREPDRADAHLSEAVERAPDGIEQSLNSADTWEGAEADEETSVAIFPAGDPPEELLAVDESAASATAEAPRPGFYSWPATVLFCLVVGACVTLSLMIARCVNCLRSIYRHRTTEFDEPLRQRLQDLAKKLRIRRVPRIIVSDVLFGPAVLGLWRHTIVLPRCLLQTSRSFLPERIFAEGEPARIESKNAGLPVDTACTQVAASREVLPGREDLLFLDPILAHELLHIRRGDLTTGALQALVQSLWWFHPAVWLCNRWLSREAERCCDEQVIAELGCSPAQYARSLLSVIESKHQLQPIPVFPGMKPVEITTQRMERIMSLRNGLKKQTPLWCWLAVAALAIVVLPGAKASSRVNEDTAAMPTTEETVGSNSSLPSVDTASLPSTVFLGRSLTDGVRLDDDFVISPDLPISGSTVIAYVNDRPITVEACDEYLWNKLLQTDGIPDSLKRLTVLESIASGLPWFVYDELVSQHISEHPPENAFNKVQNDAERKDQNAAEMQTALRKRNREVCENYFENYVAALPKASTNPREQARRMSSLLLAASMKNHPKDNEVNAYIQEQHDHSVAIDKPAVVKYVQEIVSIARLRTVVSLDLKTATLDEAVSSLSNALGVSLEIRSLDFQIGSRVFAKPSLTTFHCSNVPLSEAINSVFQPYGMKLHLNGESVVLAFTDSQMCMDRFQSLPGPPAYGIFGNGVNEGWKAIEKEVRLLDAIAQFGGIPLTDDATISITNPEIIAGKAIPVSMSLRVLQKKSSEKLNRILRDGDIVTVSRKDPSSYRAIRRRKSDSTFASKDPSLDGYDGPRTPEWVREPVADSSPTPLVPSPSTPSDRAKKWFKEDVWVQNANGHFQHDGILVFFNQQEVVGDGHSIRIKPLAMICPQEKNEVPITITADSALLETSMKVTGAGGHLAKIVSGTLEGNVRITSSDGTRIEGQKFQISEDAMNVSTFEPVTFSWNKSTGEAEGGAMIRLRPAADAVENKLTDGDPIRNIRLYGPSTINDQSTSLDVEAGKTKPANPPVVMVYSVADLVRPITKTKVTASDAGAAEISPEPFRAPASTKQDLAEAHLDFSSLVELIKASVEPESWDTGPGAATIAENRDVIGLVIRQSKEAHEAIAKLLSQLRKSQDGVLITCRLLKIATDAQLKGLEDKCSLHSLSDDQRWALLTKTRSEALQKFLADEKVETLSCPTIMTISGQAALVQVATTDGAALTGFQLSANPHLIADSSVIRLSHSVTVGELAKDTQAAAHESLVGSGQTLLLVIEQPGKVDGQPDRFVVMLTPEHLKEEEETLPR